MTASPLGRASHCAVAHFYAVRSSVSYRNEKERLYPTHSDASLRASTHLRALLCRTLPGVAKLRMASLCIATKG